MIYVKGAYNDAIAAINRVKENMDILDNEYGSEIAGLYDSIENQRVVIYTTWDDDSETTPVTLQVLDDLL